jgi:hypothetical protein
MFERKRGGRQRLVDGRHQAGKGLARQGLSCSSDLRVALICAEERVVPCDLDRLAMPDS